MVNYIKATAMKTWIFSMTAAGILLTSCGSGLPESEVPSVVKNTLATTFPHNGPVEWEKEKGNYEAEFREDTLDYKALISPEGAVLRYKQEIAAGELPPQVQQTLQAQYRDHEVEDLERVVRGKEAYYQLELEKGLKEMRLVVTPKGEVTNAVPFWD